MAIASASSPTTLSTQPRKGLHIALWCAQVLLAAMFGFGGFMKATAPFAELAKQMAFAPVVGEAVTRFIGVSELAGAVGLLLPALTRILPKLTALAAAGLATVMVLAIGYHVVHSEWNYLPVNAGLGGLAAFIAWGRFRGAPIAPRF